MPPDSAPLALATAFPVPLPGTVHQVQRGRWQILFEAHRGGISLLAHDGRRSERFFVGVAEDAAIVVALRPPRHPVQVRLAEIVTVAPGARLRGYVRVPLCVVISARRGGEAQDVGANGDGAELVELLPQGFKTAWVSVGTATGYVDQVTSSFALDARDGGGEAEVVVPVVLHNVTDRAVSPAVLTLRLRGPELRGMRGGWIAPPRRLHFEGEAVRELVRPFVEKAS